MDKKEIAIIKADYKIEDIERMDAIEQLQSLGMQSKEAEALVEKWDEEND